MCHPYNENRKNLLIIFSILHPWTFKSPDFRRFYQSQRQRYLGHFQCPKV